MLRLDLDDEIHGAVDSWIGGKKNCLLSRGRAASSCGERFGLIRFGSRVDIYLPSGVMPQVIVGQRCIAGETVLADLSSDEVSRIGEIR